MSQGKKVETGKASLVLLLALAGCAHASGPAPSAATPSDVLRSELSTLREQLAERDRVLTQLESRLSLLEAEQRQLRYALAEQKASALGVRETVRIGEGAAVAESTSRPARSEPRPVLRLYEDRRPRSEEPLQAVPEVSERLPVAPLPDLASARAGGTVDGPDGYVRALDLLRKRDFAAALAALDEFLARAPRDPRAGRALFWRGEALFAQKQYDQALKAFEAALAREPEGEKAADALLKVGLCHKRLGAPERARAAMNQLKIQFPDSQAARLAQAEEA